jgi:hypothetical protein
MRYALLIPGALLMAACSDLTVGDGERLDYAIFTVATTSTGTGQVQTEPSAFFFTSDNASLPTTRTSENACVVQPVVTTPGTAPLFVSPGDSVGFSVGANTGWLKRSSEASVIFGTDQAATFSPGTDITFTILGEGQFPASTITGPTAEPVTILPIVLAIDAAEGGVPVTWSPAGDANSKLVLTLQYATGESPNVNEQILCSFQDDGSDVIPGSIAGGWIAATLRTNTGRRFRTTTVRQGDAVLHINATFEVTVETQAVAEAALAPR